MSKKNALGGISVDLASTQFCDSGKSVTLSGLCLANWKMSSLIEISSFYMVICKNPLLGCREGKRPSDLPL